MCHSELNRDIQPLACQGSRCVWFLVTYCSLVASTFNAYHSLDWNNIQSLSGPIDAALLASAFSAYYHFDLVLAAALIDLSFNLILVAPFIASAFLA